jgi:hypothetical protein
MPFKGRGATDNYFQSLQYNQKVDSEGHYRENQ